MTLVRFFCFFLLLAGGFDSQAADRPNVVFIVADDLGYRDMGCFGGEEIKTPHLDALANEGVRATSFYVSWPACTPSRASLMTGRYPQRNGLYDMIRNDMVNYGHRFTPAEYALSPEMTLGMDLREITIAEVLKKAGYRTGIVGKWDGGRARRYLPLQRGFDSFYGFANTGIDYWTHERYGAPSMMRGNEDIKEEGYATELFRREALHFIRENQTKPFFLYLPFNAPHGASNLEKDSYQSPEKFLQMYPAGTTTREKNRSKYMAMVTCLDEAIGDILNTLKQLKLAENTLVIFISDNGGGSIADNRPLRGTKSQMWEGGIRVPFIARWPNKIPAGTVSEEFLTSLEVFPTLVSVTKAKSPKGVKLDGFDFLPVLQGKTKSPRTEMFWERRLDKAARIGNYKWVDSEKGGGLFDLSTDISEKHDLSADQPELLAKMKTRFASWTREMEASEPRGPFRNY
ncbi:MAG: sulfatase-like hydrolase/transferase [Verrucomicrobia bacterium]|nr:sulfatase-like hydrolase/transferase [Verrucomicrobiota bacterium]